MPVVKPANPRLRRLDGAPSLWLACPGPRRTFGGDAGDVGDLAGNTPALVRPPSATWATGPYGPAVAFDGAPVPLPFTVTGPNLTLSIRFRLSQPAGGFYGLFTTRDDGFCGLAFTGSGGNICGSWNATVGEYNSGPQMPVLPGVPYQAVMTLSPTLLVSYLFNLASGAVDSYAIPGTYGPRPLRNWGLGGDPGIPDRSNRGIFDDVRHYPRGLSAAEVAREVADPYWRLHAATRVAPFLQASPAFRPWLARPALVLGSGVS